MDWKRVERDVNNAKKQLKLNAEKPTKEVRTKVDEVRGYHGLLQNGGCFFSDSCLICSELKLF